MQHPVAVLPELGTQGTWRGQHQVNDRVRCGKCFPQVQAEDGSPSGGGFMGHHQHGWLGGIARQRTRFQTQYPGKSLLR